MLGPPNPTPVVTFL